MISSVQQFTNTLMRSSSLPSVCAFKSRAIRSAAVVEVDPVARLGRLEAQGYRQMAFIHTRRPQKDNVVAVGQKAQGGQFLHLPLVDRTLEGKVEGFERLGKRKLGEVHQRLSHTLVGGPGRLAEYLLQEVGVGELTTRSFLGHCVQHLGNPA
jgi:hypothetical protein